MRQKSESRNPRSFVVPKNHPDACRPDRPRSAPFWSSLFFGLLPCLTVPSSVLDCHFLCFQAAENWWKRKVRVLRLFGGSGGVLRAERVIRTRLFSVVSFPGPVACVLKLGFPTCKSLATDSHCTFLLCLSSSDESYRSFCLFAWCVGGLARALAALSFVLFVWSNFPAVSVHVVI